MILRAIVLIIGGIFVSLPVVAGKTVLPPSPIPTTIRCPNLLLAHVDQLIREANQPALHVLAGYTVDINEPLQPFDGYVDAVIVAFLEKRPNEAPKLLLGLRGRGNGAGTWGIPGGKVDYLPDEPQRRESLFAAAQRETREETGMNLLEARLVEVTLSREPNGQQFRVFTLLATKFEGTPTVQDFDETKALVYQPVDALGSLPEGLFKPIPVHELHPSFVARPKP